MAALASGAFVRLDCRLIHSQAARLVNRKIRADIAARIARTAAEGWVVEASMDAEVGGATCRWLTFGARACLDASQDS